MDGCHLLTCVHTRRRPTVVSQLCRVLLDWLFERRWSSSLNETHNKYDGSEDRPDIIVYDSDHRPHPWWKDPVRMASQEEGHAAAQAERKQTKYDNEKQPDALSPTYILLVFEHVGHRGKRASEHLNTLSKNSRDGDGKLNTAQFGGYWRNRLAATLQCCNATAITSKLHCLLAAASSVGRDDFLRVQSFLH